MTPITVVRYSPLPERRVGHVPLSFGVPFVRGAANPEALSTLVVTDSQQHRLPAAAQPLARWVDGSVRWALVSVSLPPETPNDGVLSLGWGPADQGADDASPLAYDAATQSVRRADGSHVVFSSVGNAPTAALVALAEATTADARVTLDMRDVNGERVSWSDGQWSTDRRSDALVQRVVWTGRATLSTDPRAPLNVALAVRVFAHTSSVEVSVRVHNPRAARHYDGRWDLGDPGSAHLGSVSVKVRPSAPMGAFDVQCEASQDRVSVDAPWSLRQVSSGGDHWQSPVHVNADGKVDLPFRGYALERDGARIATGNRASPLVRAHCDTARGVGVYATHFWQDFPTAVTADSDGLAVEFFPQATEGGFELQGGEQKTRTLFVDPTGEADALAWCRTPPAAMVDPDYLAETRAAPLMSLDRLPDALEQIVHGGVSGNDSFFAKRELIDEYGWRHFGDLYADHETLNYPGEPPLVSHYNNQYDPVESFWRQSMRSADWRWLELGRDLANHVVDIDIYRTEQDRPEYNNGLLWHTDHYVHAHTATHRTYSRHNDTSCDGDVGGGPGNEHCYTSGLASLYFLTGESRYRDAALLLTDWIHALHQPKPGLMAWLERTVRVDLKRILAALRGRRVHRFRHPLTRGTGNYLNTLIDAYLLTGEQRYIEYADTAIRDTLHPAEDLAERHLLDVELRWSYLVMLQAMCRFIAVCDADDLAPDAVAFASLTVVRFARWMAAHEEPFLSRPEHLDFPNETWVAQDLRKAWLFLAAANLSAEDRATFEAQAARFVGVVEDGLVGSENASHTRILILLMQNRPADAARLRAPKALRDRSLDVVAADIGDVPVWRTGSLVKAVLSGLLGALRRPSLRREIDWFRFRFRDRMPRFGKRDA